MIITQKIFEAGMSDNGGWSKEQLQALGIKTTAWNKGWRFRLIGQDIPKNDIDLFLSLKNKHLKKGKIIEDFGPNLFGIEDIRSKSELAIAR